MLDQALAVTTTNTSFLLVLAIVTPVAGALIGFVIGGRAVAWIAYATLPVGVAIAAGICAALASARAPLEYLLGAWAPPLGIALRADGLSAVMIGVTALVVCAVAVYSSADFHPRRPERETRPPFAWWILLLAVWSALNTVFVAGDLFTLYVALELLTFAAVPLVCLDGRPETFQAALRYLLFALLGSVLYLAGAALLYGATGTLDIVLLSRRLQAGPTTSVALVLMTVGLLAKTALFPLHLWLPPAHAGAPAPGSAILSALVVKGSFFITVRLWFDVMPDIPGLAAGQLLGSLGAAAILFGSVLALRQRRLKLLIAYSTLAQIGYLFLMVPLAFAPASGEIEHGGALSGGFMQAISHATAKAAMFLAAGSIYAGLGHDRLAQLGGAGRVAPIALLAFALGGLALVGVPTSGAYLAKDLLLGAAAETAQWWWAAVVQTGGAFTAAYLVLVLGHAFRPVPATAAPVARVPWLPQIAALSLALCSLMLGLIPWDTYLAIPEKSVGPTSVLKTLWATLWPLLAGALLAVLLAHRPPWPGVRMRARAEPAIGPLRNAMVALAGLLERLDVTLRQWPAAGLSLVLVAAAFSLAML